MQPAACLRNNLARDSTGLAAAAPWRGANVRCWIDRGLLESVESEMKTSGGLGLARVARVKNGCRMHRVWNAEPCPVPSPRSLG